MPKKAIIRINDEVNALILGLEDEDRAYFFNKYGLLVKGATFLPIVKLGRWDGKVRFFSAQGKTYVQLLEEIVPELELRGYNLELIDDRPWIDFRVPLIDKHYLSQYPNPNDPGQPLILGDHQVEAVNAATQVNMGIIVGGTGCGKAQPLYSKILTPSGWKRMADIRLNDVVLTPSNAHSTVIGVHPRGKRPIYKVNFDDGTSACASDDHLWECFLPERQGSVKLSLKRHAKSKFVKTTTELIDALNFYTSIRESNKGTKHPSNHSKTICVEPTKPLVFATNLPVPLDPYILGCLLGDGSIKYNAAITTMDAEIVDYFSKWAAPLGLSLKKTTKDNGKASTYAITKIRRTGQQNPLVQTLRALGIFGHHGCDKFIPEQYKFASIDERIRLVQGLFDTNGSIDKGGRITYSTCSVRLRDDLTDVLRSLGMVVRSREKRTSFIYRGERRIGRISYELYVSFKDDMPIVSLERKKKLLAQRVNHAWKNAQVYKRIISINYVGDQECQCISIDDPGHLYITDDFIPTHNSIIAATLCNLYKRYMNYKCLIIVPTDDLVSQTSEDIEIFGNDTGIYSGSKKDLNHDHIVSTWQALQHNKHIAGNFHVIIVDECFDRNTMITMADGSFKFIDEVTIGEKIISYNIEKRQFEEDRVVKVHTNLKISESEKMYQLEFDDGTLLEVTGNHMFLTERGYIRADQLSEDDEILNVGNGRHTAMMLGLNKILRMNNNDLRIVKYDGHILLLNNGIQISIRSEIHRFASRAKSKFLCFKMDKLYSIDDAEQRNVLSSNLRAQQSSQHLKKRFDELPIAEQEKIRCNMRLTQRKAPKDNFVGHTPWNKNKTKDDDVRLLNLSISRTGQNNPSYGRPYLESSRQKQRSSIRKSIMERRFTPKSNNRRTHFDCEFNGQKYRSSWEAIYAALNPDAEYEELRIPYIFKGVTRTYVVDFISHTSKLVCEVKPYSMQSSELHIAKCQAAINWCSDNGFEFRVIDANYFIDHLSRVDYSKIITRNLDRKVKAIRREASKKNRNT